MREFVNFYLDRAKETAGEVGYLGLPDQMYTAARTYFRKRTTGTHFANLGSEDQPATPSELYLNGNLIE